MAPSAKGWIGDTLWIIDPILRRASYFHATGRLIKTEPLDIAMQNPLEGLAAQLRPTSMFLPHARDANGSTLGSIAVSGTLAGKELRNASAIAFKNASGKMKVLGLAPYTDDRWGVVFGPASIVGYSPRAKYVVIARINSLTRAGADISLEWIGVDSRVLRRSQLWVSASPMEKGARDSLIKSARDIEGRSLRSVVKVPPVHPPIEAVHIDSEDRVWLTVRTSSTARSLWLLNKFGKPIAQAPLPTRSYVASVAPTHLWLRTTDAEDESTGVKVRFVCDRSSCAKE